MPDCSTNDRQDTEPVYVGVSTKMYLGYADSLEWLAGIRHEVDIRPALAAGRVVPFVVPTFPVLPAANRILEGSPVRLGAQNCGWEDGPWTGEVAPSLLGELGVGLVEIGHAERRRHFGEDNAMIARKVRAADDAGITPLLCVGEEAQDGTTGPTAAATFVHRQIHDAVGGDWALASRLIVAYEPVWAIGAAEPAGAGYISAVLRSLRMLLEGEASGQGGTPGSVPIIYGGSAKPGLLPLLHGASGLFLGRFAHDPGNFGKVLDEALALIPKASAYPVR
ncbi:triose-phosphate isomerase [Arthrobacter sp. PGP41]|uniref:triose-phosphate isomerase family protein n=1 Tax=unclassified Arthrobacter TaxID=235627 RepID=UPI000CDC3634|nr:MULTISPECIES: triose-phosphate isomerase family protein [unclassified Arthrobacter]AUZ34872.1 triose-phosphate isomerase [Arthrobacter sp. PGP41]MDT0195958.1 triose-phosphate isomerase family protein [Arthrobacter sp. AB6]